MSGPSRARLGRRFPNQPTFTKGRRLSTNAKANLTSASTQTWNTPRVRFGAICRLRSGTNTVAGYVTEPGYNSTLYPNGVQRPYRVVVRDAAGTKYGELEQFRIESIDWELNGDGGCDIRVPLQGPQVSILQVPDREVQIWRGTQLIWWGVAVKATADTANKSVRFTCKLLSWYFSRRFFGKAGRTNLLNNPDFELGTKGIAYWTHLTTMWFLNFIPADTGNVRAVQGNTGGAPATMLGDRCLAITNPDYSAAGIPAQIAESVHEFIFQDTVISGGPNGKHVVFAAWVYVPSSGYIRPDIKEVGLLLARIPWYGTTSSGTPIPDYMTAGPLGASAGYRNLYVVSKQVITTRISKVHVKDKWVRHVCEIDIPPNVTETIHARLNGIIGTMYFDAAYLAVDEAFENLRANGDDQAELAMREVWHAQGYPNAHVDGSDNVVRDAYDASYNKSDLNITADYTTCPKTGVMRYRKYRYVEHQAIDQALQEFPTLYQGLDWEVTWPTPDTRAFTTYYPLKGVRDAATVLELGKNIISCQVDVDGQKTANVVIVMSPSTDAAREEVAAVDTTTLSGGLTLEVLYHALPGSTINTLYAQAQKGLSKFRQRVTIPQVTLHDDGGHLFNRIRVGNTYPVVINLGWLSVNADYRVVGMSLNPNTEEITLTLNQVFAT